MTKLHPLAKVLCIVAAGLPIAAAAKDEPSLPNAEPCAAASAYIDHMLRSEGFNNSKPVILDTQPERVFEYSKYARDIIESPHPLATAYRQLESRRDDKIHEVCPDLTNQFDRLRLRSEDDDPSQSEAQSGEYEVIYLSLSVPGISADGESAILTAGVIFADLDGYGVEAMLVKDADGNWRFEEDDGTWIS